MSFCRSNTLSEIVSHFLKWKLEVPKSKEWKIFVVLQYLILASRIENSFSQSYTVKSENKYDFWSAGKLTTLFYRKELTYFKIHTNLL